MRYPNRRYGNPAELAYFAGFYPDKERLKILSKELRRDERTIRDWLSGRQKLPFWVPELLRLRRMEHNEMLRQMGMRPMDRNFGIVRGQIIQFENATSRHFPKPPTSFELRKDDFAPASPGLVAAG